MTTIGSQRQREIAEWAEQTFGVSSALRAATRTNEEVAEMLSALASGVPATKVAEECADVYICGCRLASLLRVDLDAEFAPAPALLLPSLAQATDNARSAVAFSARMVSASFVDDARGMSRNLRDLAVLARWLCFAVGVDFDAAVAVKMMKNRGRQWALDGSGCGYHIEPVKQVDTDGGAL